MAASPAPFEPFDPEVPLKPGGPRILVIDDDPASKDALADLIQSEGWSFYDASGEEEALAAVDDVEPEVIVLDPIADRGKARELLVSLRRNHEWIPVVLYTSDPAIDAPWALEHGASGVERKPKGLVKLREKISELLDDQRTDRPL
jgi:two-component system response regulator MprA